MVGAGVIGLAVGCELARRGASVQIVDERGAGKGATQASAGILAPYIEADGQFLDFTVRSLNLFDEFIARLIADSGIVVPYRRTGTLQVAGTLEAMGALRARADRLKVRGVELALLDADAVRAAEPHLSSDVVGGLLVPAHGFVVVGDLVRALVTAAGHWGAQFIDARVRRISQSGSDLAVDTDDRSVKGTRVVLAAGSWSGRIEIDGVEKTLPIRPVRGQLLHLAWTGPRLARVIWSDRCYLVPWDDGTLLVGATVEDAGFDERTTVAGVRDLLDAASALVPHASSSSFLGARVGLRPASPDEMPILGPSRRLNGLTYASGHYRNGVLLAPLTARLVSDAVLDNVTDDALAALRPGRFGDF